MHPIYPHKTSGIKNSCKTARSCSTPSDGDDADDDEDDDEDVISDDDDAVIGSGMLCKSSKVALDMHPSTFLLCKI